MPCSWPCRIASVALVVFAWPATAARVELTAGGEALEPAGAWTATAPGVARAPDHPLDPVLAVGSHAVLEASLPGAGTVRMVPLGFASRGTTVRELPLAEPVLQVGASGPMPLPEHVALVASSWVGVDELFDLRGAAVKHDLAVHADALGILGRGDLVVSWALELPSGVQAVHAQDGSVHLESGGSIVGRLPAPVVADGDDPHWLARLARFELHGIEGSVRVDLVVPAAWAFDTARAFPLRIDPTITVEPLGDAYTGWVDEDGTLATGAIDSGSLVEVFYGSDVRGFAEFDTSPIPDGAVVTDVRLQVWLSNHDNPLDPAVPLPMEVKGVTERASSPPPLLWLAIGGLGSGTIYASEDVPRTGAQFCPDSYEFREYDLGPVADADLAGLLAFDWFTLGFVSGIVTDPLFDHIDYIGYPETVLNFACPTMDMPGSRIKLIVDYAAGAVPVCDAGGPYAADCPHGPIALDGSGSFDPDLDPLTYAWTTDCPGTIDTADQPMATLNLDAGCAADCLVTLSVSDGSSTVSCSATVTARDLTPPEILSSAMTDYCLWPPRHDMFCVGDASGLVVARDACQPGVTYRWSGCESDQPDEAREAGRPENGDGHFSDDCQPTPDGGLCVRVERAGSDPVDGHNTYEGRRYRVAVEVDDGCGNVVSVPGTLWVPHDRRGGAGGQDDPCEAGSKEK